MLCKLLVLESLWLEPGRFIFHTCQVFPLYVRLRLLFLIVVPSSRKVGLYQGWLSRILGSRISFFFLEPD